MKKAWVAFLVLIACMMTVGFLAVAEAAEPPAGDFYAESFEGQAAVFLAWNNPDVEEEDNFDGVVIRRSTIDYPDSATAGPAVYSGFGESYWDDQGITLGTTYYYTIWAKYDDGTTVTYTESGQDMVVAGDKAADYFTQAFCGDFDLQDAQLIFVPDSSSMDYYDLYYGSALDCDQTYLENPSGTNTWMFGDDDALAVNLSGTFPFYGNNFSTVYIGSNGWVSFDSADALPPESCDTLIENHFEQRRISVFGSDLTTNGSSTISYFETSEKFVVTWEDAYPWSYSDSGYDPDSDPATVQLEMFFDGEIRISIISVPAEFNMADDYFSGIVVGLSPQTVSTPADFNQSDLSDEYPSSGIRTAIENDEDPYPMYELRYVDLNNRTSNEPLVLADGSIWANPSCTLSNSPSATLTLSDSAADGYLVIRRLSPRFVAQQQGIDIDDVTYPPITAVYAPGRLRVLYSQAQIGKVVVGGALDRAILAGAYNRDMNTYVKDLNSGNLGEVRMQAQAKSSSTIGDQFFSTSIASGDTYEIYWNCNLETEPVVVEVPQTIDTTQLNPDLNAIQVLLDGVGLQNFYAPNQQADIRLSVKKFAWICPDTGNRNIDASIASILNLGDNAVEAGYLRRLTSIGGGYALADYPAIAPAMIVSNAALNNSRTFIYARGLNTVVTVPSTTPGPLDRLVEVFPGDIRPEEIESQSDELVIGAVFGNIGSDASNYELEVESAGAIPFMRAIRGYLDLGSGYAMAGVDNTLSSDIGIIQGQWGVDGEFRAGADDMDAPTQGTGSIRIIAVDSGFNIVGTAYVDPATEDDIRLIGDQTAVLDGRLEINPVP